MAKTVPINAFLNFIFYFFLLFKILSFFNECHLVVYIQLQIITYRRHQTTIFHPTIQNVELYIFLLFLSNVYPPHRNKKRLQSIQKIGLLIRSCITRPTILGSFKYFYCIWDWCYFLPPSSQKFKFKAPSPERDSNKTKCRF